MVSPNPSILSSRCLLKTDWGFLYVVGLAEERPVSGLHCVTLLHLNIAGISVLSDLTGGGLRWRDCLPGLASHIPVALVW